MLIFSEIFIENLSEFGGQISFMTLLFASKGLEAKAVISIMHDFFSIVI
jgi:hypothetical protein